MDVLEEDLNYIVNYKLPYENLKNCKVLVTGATGLIGVSLIRALLSIGNIEIIAFVRDEEKFKTIFKNNINIKIVVGDISKDFVINYKIDYIFHCASITNSKLMIEKPVETILTSVDGTKNVLNLAKEKKVKSFVYVSSMEIYGSFDQKSKDITEKDLGYIDPLKVRSDYPESKRLCENLCIAYLNEYNVPVKIARLAQTFGAGILPWESRIFSQLAKSVINNENIILHSTGLSEGNYCYIRDCITGLLTILLLGKNGEAYNVSNPANHTTILDMANMVANKIAKGKIKVTFDIPSDNIYGYANETKMKLNSNKLMLLGWKPEISLEESYIRMIEYMTNVKFKDKK